MVRHVNIEKYLGDYLSDTGLSDSAVLLRVAGGLLYCQAAPEHHGVLRPLREQVETAKTKIYRQEVRKING